MEAPTITLKLFPKVLFLLKTRCIVKATMAKTYTAVKLNRGFSNI